MSRRHHGRPHHPRYRHDSPRPDGAANRPTPSASSPAPTGSSNGSIPPAADRAAATAASIPTHGVPDPLAGGRPPVAVEPSTPTDGGPPASAPLQNGDRAANGPVHTGNGAPLGPASHDPAPQGENGNGGHGGERPHGCTAPQLRRFIKSRPYVPMHELRRRFAIDGTDDDVTHVDLQDGRVYVGLPPREGLLLGELLRGGEIGYELSFDPLAPIVVGVYPMRPVPRS